MKHKICYVLPEYKEDAATHFSYIGNLLAEASRELDIFLLIEKGEFPKNDFGCAKVKLIGSSGILFRAVKLKFWLLYARSRGYRDCYIHYSFLAAFIASCLAKIYGGRVFYWNCGEPWKYKRSFLRERFERMTYRMVTFVVTGTGHLAHEYASRYKLSPEKTKVMPNWIDTERFKEEPDKKSLRKKLGLPDDKKIILFAHHLSLRKGSRMIFPVATDILRVRKDIFFAIIGTGPDEEKLRSRSGKSDVLRPHMRFLGAVPNRDMQKYFAVADAFFMPSQEEGFPRVILEAMASGVPIVASDVGSVAELVPSSVKPFIVHSDDAIRFARSLNSVLSQTAEEKQSLQKELRARAAEFTTSIVSEKFVNLFQ